MVEGIVCVGFVEEHDEAVDDGIHVEHRLPVLAQDVEAHGSLPIDVGVINGRHTARLWRLVRVRLGHGNLEDVRGILPQPRVCLDCNVEKHEVALVRPVNLGDFAGVELGNICGCQATAPYSRQPTIG